MLPVIPRHLKMHLTQLRTNSLAMFVSSILLFLSGLKASAQSTAPTATEHFQNGWNSELEVVSPNDVKKAISHYEKAVEAGDLFAKARLAQLKLGYKLQPREIALKACRETASIVNDRADAGDSIAVYMKAENHAFGVYGEEQKGVALKWYHQAALLGVPAAQTILGHCLFEGTGQPYFGNGKPDPGAAVSWFQKAYEQGYLYAAAYLAYCQMNGVGMDRDPEHAIEMYRLLADRGNARSQALLGGILLHGMHIPKNAPLALFYLRKAADQEDLIGLTCLAGCLFQGVGVAPNHPEAIRLFRRAAALESADAQAILGACYEEGKGVEKDSTTAFSWYLLAARNGNVISQGRVGLFYLQGIGCDVNQISGLAWLRLAAKNGDEKSREVVAYMENYLRETAVFNEQMDNQISSLQQDEELLIRDAERRQQVIHGERRSHNGFTAKDFKGY